MPRASAPVCHPASIDATKQNAAGTRLSCSRSRRWKTSPLFMTRTREEEEEDPGLACWSGGLRGSRQPRSVESIGRQCRSGVGELEQGRGEIGRQAQVRPGEHAAEAGRALYHVKLAGVARELKSEIAALQALCRSEHRRGGRPGKHVFRAP